MADTNSVDLAIRKVRILQQMILNPKNSQMDLFNYTEVILGDMAEASQQIKANYEEISRQLTIEMTQGKGAVKEYQEKKSEE